jgi:hypothetical protein
LNPAKAIVWNSHKRYLLDLRAAGVAVPALRLVPQGATFDTAKFLAEPHDVAPQLASAPASAGDRDLASDDDGVSDGVRDVDGASDGDDRWADVVIKPAVSASAYRTWRASTVTIDESAVRVAAMLTEGDVILQRFVPEIATAGEWSLIMVDGELNHAVRRVPAAGDFRSQRDYGAAVTLGDPPRALMATARLALACAGQHGGEPYVARLDLVETASGPVVMEVELIEPSLYLVDAADAATRIAAAIHRRAASAAAL